MEAAAPILASQYNDVLQPQFASYRTTSISIVEKENVRQILVPLIDSSEDKRVLELACGSGFYTFDLLRWGASEVTAVDFSPDMMSTARDFAHQQNITKISFRIADMTEPAAYSDQPFDLVFAAWPLEYSKDKQTLTDMFRTVAMNLRSGGTFVCVTRVPCEDPRNMSDETNRVRPKGGGGVVIQNLEDVKDGGILIRLVGANAAHGDVSFVCVHWKKSVMESAARDAGFTGPLSWTLTSVPEEFLTDGQIVGGADLQEMRSYAEVPEYGILQIRK